MNAISFALFGYDTSYENCLSFKSYLRGAEINIRMTELLYGKDWKVHFTLDEQTFFSPYKEFFNEHKTNGKIDFDVIPREALCKMMLRRVAPVFSGKYDRVACRDTDSLITYKEVQATAHWIKKGRIAHAMTDSISHNIPMMGGLISFMSKEFIQAMGVHNFESMVEMKGGIDYNKKGADQDFINAVIYPRVAHSITQHYLLGMRQTFMGDCHHEIHDIDIGLPQEFKETNSLGWHLGAAGFQTDQTILLLNKHGKDNNYYNEIESRYPEVFYWQLK